jgi:hypothetical protein
MSFPRNTSLSILLPPLSVGLLGLGYRLPNGTAIRRLELIMVWDVEYWHSELSSNGAPTGTSALLGPMCLPNVRLRSNGQRWQATLDAKSKGQPTDVHMQVFLTKLFRARYDLEMVVLRYAYAFDASEMANGARHPNGETDRDKAHVYRQLGATRNRKKKGVDLNDDINFEQVAQFIGAHVRADRHVSAG